MNFFRRTWVRIRLARRLGMFKKLGDNPDMAEMPYGDAMAASLSRAFPCLAQ